MKSKRIILISFLLLAIMMLGAVSAANKSADTLADNATDNNPTLDESEYITVTVSPNDTLRLNEYLEISANVSEDTNGYIQYYFDQPDEDEYSEYIDHDQPFYTYTRISSFGDHVLHVKFLDGNRPDKSFEFPFTITDFYLNVYPDSETAVYGKDVTLCIDIPSNAYGTLTMLVNGKKYQASAKYGDEWVDEWPEEITIKKEDIRYANNTLNMTFTPQDSSSQFKAKSIDKTFQVNAIINAPYYAKYRNGENVTLTLPKDATGKLIIQIDDNATYSAEVKNGFASVALPDLDEGLHSLYARFDGNYNVERYDSNLDILPNVDLNDYLWADGPQNITIETSRSGEFDLYINGEQIQTVQIKDGKATFNLNLSEGYYDFSIMYQNNTIFDKFVSVLTESPYWTMNITTTDVLRQYAFLYIENYPGYIHSGIECFELYVDGVKMELEEANSYIRFNATSLENGNHTYVLKFLGDGYYKPTSASGTFKLDNIMINCPEKYVDGYADENMIEAFLPDNAGGLLTVNVNGKKAYSKNIEKEDTDYYRYETVYLDDLDLKLNGKNTIEVTFKSDKFTVTKTFEVIATYAIKPYSEIIYGENLIYIIAPMGLAPSKLTVTIDGVTYKAARDENDELYIRTSSPLSVGNHTAVAKYSGDATYPELTTTNTINVVAEIILDYEEGKGRYMSLTLPSDAKGNFTVYANGEIYESVRAAGSVKITFDKLHWGQYEITGNYTGDDYNVDPYTHNIIVVPNFNVKEKIIIGEENSVSVDIGVNGTLTVWAEDIDETVRLENGKATIKLPQMSVGTHYITVNFEHEFIDSTGDECSNSYTEDFKITVVNPITAKDANVLYSANEKYQVSIRDANGNPVTSGKATFYIMDGKKQILKKTIDVKNGTATLTYKITQGVKTYTIKTVFNKAEVTKKLTVNHVITLKSATVKKSAKNLILQATLKKVNGKYLSKKLVTFKFNGKTYKAKTNNKGVAKVTVPKAVLSKLKVGKTVTFTATYLKDTVKRTAKVKK